MGIMLNVHSIEPIVVEEFFSSPINFLVKIFHNNSSTDHSPYYLLQIISFIDKYHPS